MHYPYLIYNTRTRPHPIFPGLHGDPYLADLSPSSPLLEGIDMRDQQSFQKVLDDTMAGSFGWGLAAYLERRDTLLGDCPQMVAEQRFIHLGVDIIVTLGTPLHAPLDAVVEDCGYESGEGNYGAYVLLRHESREFETFYSFYGHLSKDLLPAPGTVIAGGQPFARIGDFHENGNWFHHTHLQVITGEGLRQGYISKGYCAATDLATITALCPSPLHLFVVP